MIKKCLFPGSFDPFTLGHMRLVERALNLFDEVTVLILINANKRYTFSLEDRISFIEESVSKFPNVKVVAYSGLLCDYMQESGVYTVLRGVRNTVDFDYEASYFYVNKELAPNAEIVFLPTERELCHISSSVVRELLFYRADVKKYLTEESYASIVKRYYELNDG